MVVAEKIGLPAEQVFKTLLCVTMSANMFLRWCRAMRSWTSRSWRRRRGRGRRRWCALKDVQPLTGYVRGGVTVFGAKKDFRVFVDETLELFDVVSVSAGTRGVQVVLSPADYLRATGATVADLTKGGHRAQGAGHVQERQIGGKEGSA